MQPVLYDLSELPKNLQVFFCRKAQVHIIVFAAYYGIIPLIIGYINIGRRVPVFQALQQYDLIVPLMGKYLNGLRPFLVFIALVGPRIGHKDIESIIAQKEAVCLVQHMLPSKIPYMADKSSIAHRKSMVINTPPSSCPHP